MVRIFVAIQPGSNGEQLSFSCTFRVGKAELFLGLPGD